MKENTWIIRKWADGDIDFAKLIRIQDKTITTELYYRISDDKVVDSFNDDVPLDDYTDTGLPLEFNFREATKEEIRQYSRIVIEFIKTQPVE